MKSAIELIRVSTEVQAGEDRAGIPAQRETNRRTAQVYGLRIVKSIEIVDVSGAAVLSSPQMQELMRMMETPEIHGVVTKEFSRLMRPEKFYRDQRIDYLAGTRAAEIDRAGKRLRLVSGEQLDYDHLVLATGARNRVPPLPGIELDGVCYLRNLAETDELRQRLAAAERLHFRAVNQDDFDFGNIRAIVQIAKLNRQIAEYLDDLLPLLSVPSAKH